MSTDEPSTPRGDTSTAAFLAALNVPRNAKVGAIVGIAFAALIYSVRVFELLGPAPPSAGGPILFLGLAFVLAFGAFVIVTTVLTLISAYRRAHEMA